MSDRVVQFWRPLGGATVALIVGSIALLCSSPLLFAQTSLEGPTLIEVPAGGGRAVVRGETPPSPEARLGEEQTVERSKAAQDKLAREKLAQDKLAREKLAQDKQARDNALRAKREKKAASLAAFRRSAERVEASGMRSGSSVRGAVERPRSPGMLLLLLDGGRIGLPRALSDLMVSQQHYPAFVGMNLGLSVLRPATSRQNYGLRVGLSLPLMPAANWYSDDGRARAYFTEVELLALEAAFEYVYRRRLLGPVGMMARAGLGIMVLLGDLQRTELLPVCPGDDLESCPHWRKVGKRQTPLPSRVWPALNLTLGLSANFTSSLGVYVEGGFRDGLYAGAGVSFGH